MNPADGTVIAQVAKRTKASSIAPCRLPARLLAGEWGRLACESAPHVCIE